MTTTFTAPRGAPPSVEFRQLAELEVDPAYQRPIDAPDSQRAIRAIATDWDWRLCAPLTVARRPAPAGSRFFVIDGQHRLEAARLRGDIPFLPCIISQFDDAAEEARLFVAVNTRRKKIGPLDTFRAALASGDGEAADAAKLIAAANLAVARSATPTTWAPGEIGQVGTVLKLVKRYGAEVAGQALTTLAEAFPDEVLSQAGRLLPGIASVRADPPPGFDADRFFLALLNQTQAGWAASAMRRVADAGDSQEDAMRFVMLAEYARTGGGGAPCQPSAARGGERRAAA